MPKATAIFDGDDSRLSAVIGALDKKLHRLQGQFSKVAGFTAKLFAAPAAAIAAGALGIKSVLDVGGELNDAAARTGVAAGEIQKLQLEFKNAGKEAADVVPAIQKMMKSLTSGDANEIIAQMGVDLESLKTKTPDQQFQTLSAAIDKLPDSAQKLQAAQAIFGKSGGDLLSVFSAQGAGDAAKQLGTQAALMSKDAALFDDVGDKLALIGPKVQGFFVGVADKVVPLLKPLLDGFANLDLAEMGQQVGDVVAFLIQAFSDGTLWDIVVTAGKSSLMKVGNFLAGIIAAVGKGIWQYVVESFKNAVAILEVVTTADFWKGLGNGLIAAAQLFSAMMLEGGAKLLEYLEDVPGIGGKAAAGAEALRGAAGGLRGDAAVRGTAAAGQLAPVLGKITGRMVETFANIATAIGQGFDAGNSVFDVGAQEDKLAGLVGKTLSGVSAQQAASIAAVGGPKANIPGGDVFAKEGALNVSALTRIGGNFGGGGGDPLLDENRRQTSLLRQIHTALTAPGKPGKLELIPAYG